MSVSETNTLASTSTSATATEEKNAPTQAEVVRKYKTNELINFLRKEEDLELDEDDLRIIKKEKITGRDFLKTTKDEFRSVGLALGPASRLAGFAKELGKCILRSYKTQKDLENMLGKYKVGGNDITRIPPFTPKQKK